MRIVKAGQKATICPVYTITFDLDMNYCKMTLIGLYAMICKPHHLSLLLIPSMITISVIYNGIYGIFYIPVLCGICALIIFLNFPAVVIFLHSRPIYYDDLIIKNYDGDGYIYDEDFRKKYQHIFRWIASVTSSLMVAITMLMWFLRDTMYSTGTEAGTKALNIFVILGIIGGMMRIYYSATMIIGRILLFILKLLKRREQERRRLEIERKMLIELDSIAVTSGTIIELNTRSDDRHMSVIGFKPTLMADIFN
jgi:hypothetical protein